MIKKESVNQQKWQKLLKTQTGGVKIEKYEKLGSRIKIAKIKRKIEKRNKKWLPQIQIRSAESDAISYRSHTEVKLCDK